MVLEKSTGDESALAAAERKSRTAKLLLDSSLVPEHKRNEIAFQYAIEAFRANPQSAEIFHVLGLCTAKTNRHISEIGVDLEMERSFAVDEIRDLVAKRTFSIMWSLMKEDVDEPKKDVSNPVYLMEKVYNASPSAKNAHTLGYCYAYIGRANDARELLKEAAEKDTTLYYSYIGACIAHGRYQDVVDYCEKYRPTIAEGTKTAIANAYENVMLDVEWREKENPAPAEKHLSALKQAMEIYRGIALSKETKVVNPDHVERDIAVGSFFHSAAIVAGNAKQDDLTKMGIDGTPQSFLEEGRVILESILNTFSSVEDSNPRIRDLLMRAKINLIATMASMDMGEEEAIATAEFGMRVLDEIEGKEKFANHSISSSLFVLFRRLYSLTRKEEYLSLRDSFLRKTVLQNWNNPIPYCSLMDIRYSQDDLAGVHNVNAVQTYAKMLDALIKCDVYAQKFPDKYYGFADGQPSVDLRKEFEDDFDKILRHAVNISKPLSEYFAPFVEAIRPLVERYLSFIKSIAPEGTKLLHRIKSPHSVLLKMLKLDTADFSTVTDCMAFRALTDTEEEAVILYELVKADMWIEPPVAEWKTLHDPTPRGYRSLDITGVSNTTGCLIQVQIRTKKIEERINATAAHHDYYKRKSGEALCESVNKDPIRYIGLLSEILFKLKGSFDKTADMSVPLSADDALRLYGFSKEQNPVASSVTEK